MVRITLTLLITMSTIFSTLTNTLHAKNIDCRDKDRIDNLTLNPIQNATHALWLLDDISWISPQPRDKIITRENKNQLLKNLYIKAQYRNVAYAYDFYRKTFLPIDRNTSSTLIEVPQFRDRMLILVNVGEHCKPTPNLVTNGKDLAKMTRASAFVSLPTQYIEKRNLLDIERFAANMGFTSIVRNVKSNHLPRNTLWNSTAGRQVGNHAPYADRIDHVSKMVKNAKTNGLFFYAYYKNSGDDLILSQHPEWKCHSIDNRQAHPRFPFADLSSPYRDIVLHQILELAERSVDAIYFDYIHTPIRGCFGSYTQSKYELETSLDAPKTYSQDNYNHYLAFQADELVGTFNYWKSAAQKVYPDLLFVVSTAFLSGITLEGHTAALAEIADVAKVEFETGRRESIRGNIFQHNSKELAHPGQRLLMTVAMTLPRDMSKSGMSHIWANRLPNTEHATAFTSTAIALGGVAAIDIDKNYFLRTENSLTRKTAPNKTPRGAILASIKVAKQLSEPMYGMKPKKFAAVHYSDYHRRQAVDRIALWSEVLWPTVGAYGALLEMGIPVSFVSDSMLTNTLNDYKVLFLPKPVDDMNKEIQQSIELFTDNGGLVLKNSEMWHWSDPVKSENAKLSFMEAFKQLSVLSPFQLIQAREPKAYALVYER